MLDGVDTLVVDLQDVGTRIYTFAYTMSHVMEAAAAHGPEVVVLEDSARFAEERRPFLLY